MKSAITSVYRWVPVILLTLGGCCTTTIPSQNTDAERAVTFESLLGEMTDLERLVEHPGAAYQCKQASSYDRRSTDPDILTDENWFANLDVAGLENLQQFAAVERIAGIYLMEAGPGPLWIWVAANINFAGNIGSFDHSPTRSGYVDDL